jgi:hypothetical protein
MKTPRFWQTKVVFTADKAETTLTIQSEEGRSTRAENVFVLQTIGAIRADGGWKFNFLGRATETPTFVPRPEQARLFANQVRYWLGA